MSAAGVPGAELERARAAYRGSLEEARARRAFTPGARHQDTASWSVLASLFAEPGLNRTTLVDRVVDCAGVSRPTAERVVRRARDGGHIVDRPAGRAVRYFLSDRAFDRCLGHFRDHMDRSGDASTPARRGSAGRAEVARAVTTVRS